MATPEPMIQRFYFTFGFSHRHHNRFVVIDAVDWEAARGEMLARYGREWGFQYDDSMWIKDGVSQEDRFSLTELP